MQLPSPRTQKTRNSRPIEIPTPDEICALIRACSARAPTGLRNRALLVLGWRGGLRLGEALNLYPRDLDPGAGTVNVRRGKGGKQRTIGLDPTAFAVIEHWAERRRSLNLNGNQPLICTLQGRGLLPSYVRGLIPRLARKTGLEKRAHYHALRHTLPSWPGNGSRSIRFRSSSAIRTSPRPTPTSAGSRPRRSSRRCSPATGASSSADARSALLIKRLGLTVASDENSQFHLHTSTPKTSSPRRLPS